MFGKSVVGIIEKNIVNIVIKTSNLYHMFDAFIILRTFSQILPSLRPLFGCLLSMFTYMLIYIALALISVFHSHISIIWMFVHQ